MKVELQDLLKAAFGSGINLFLGSGFSVLAKDSTGKNLPIGNKLKDELSAQFNLPGSLTLNKLSMILDSTRKAEFHEYLVNRFSVDDFNDKYCTLLNINVDSIFTTNIDNLVNKIYEKSNKHYLNDVVEFGPSFKDKVAIDYIPLHGSILHSNRKLVFNPVNIASAFNNEKVVWHYLRIKSTQNPTLFWGYSLEDSGVIEALFSESEKIKDSKPKWIILYEEDEASISYFKALGFNIIIGDTNSMLDWIEQNKSTSDHFELSLVNDTKEVFFGLNIPNRDSNLPVRPLKYFFMGDVPLWSDIYNNRIPKTRHFEKILNVLYSNDKKNIILTGIPACGKTTLMMQLAASYDFNGHKLICSDINMAKANLIYDRLMGEPAIIFIDNFTNDIEVFNFFASKPNIKLFGADREYYLEIIFHKMDNKTTEIYNCTSLDLSDIQVVYNNIPNEVRKDKLNNKNNTNKDMSMFEFVNLNILGPTINERYKEVITQLDNSNQLALDLLLMICYVNRCRTAVSYDMIDMFLNDDIDSHGDIYELLRTLGGLITEYSGEFAVDEQDYFVPRSYVIAEKIIENTPNDIFKDVFTRFHNYVPHYSITRFDIFKKFAYDAYYVKKSFPKWEEGMRFYENIVEYDSSPFIYQQGALYLLSKKRYTEAFNWIDKALLKANKNIFSIKNSHAVILFEANINSSDLNQSRPYLDESMSILESCRKSDLRKLYHSITYAKNAIKYYELFGDSISQSYLSKANRWLLEEKTTKSWNFQVKDLLRQLSLIIKL